MKKLFQKFNSITAYLVDGNTVRKAHQNFKEYGMHRTHQYIPKNEIWIDDRLSNKDRHLLALSALKCYNLSNDGAKVEDMHKSVDKIMVKCAKSPLLIPYRINREIAKMRRREKML